MSIEAKHGRVENPFLADRFAGFFPGLGFFTALTAIRTTFNFPA
jgi:hypothetical protein